MKLALQQWLINYLNFYLNFKLNFFVYKKLPAAFVFDVNWNEADASDCTRNTNPLPVFIKYPFVSVPDNVKVGKRGS